MTLSLPRFQALSRIPALHAVVLATVWSGAFATPVLAADAAPDRIAEPDAIIVTARKVPESALDVPASLSILTARGLEDERITSFADVTGSVPNVAFSGGIGGQLQGQIAIRGIATLVRNIGVESGVGVYVDGVYVGRPEAYNQELLDIAQVEVLRGPQGTIFGKNTIAGVLTLSSAAPTRDLTGSARVEAGNFGLVRTQATLSGPLAGDALTGRIALGYASRDGFYRHVSGGRDADGLDLFSWRGALAFAPSDRLTVTLRTDGLRDRGTPGFFSATDIGLPGAPGALPPRQIDNNRPNALRRDIAGVSLTAVATLGEMVLTSISAYRQSRYAASLDDDQRQADLLTADLFGDRSELWSQELRLNGKAGDRLNWLAGVYLLDQITHTDRTLAIGMGLGIPGAPQLTTRGRVATRSYAAFGSVDWRLAERLTLSAGLRYTYERKSARFVQDDETGIFAMLDLPDIAFAGRSVDHDVSPTVSLTYAAAPGVRLYGRVARGFKSAAFNVDLAASANGLTAGPEHATTYEGGVKADLLDRRLTLALTRFHTDYADLQVAQITGAGTALSNAGRASIDGFEVEVTARPLDGVRLEGAAGYADAKYDRFAQCAVPLSEGGGASDCAGKALTGAPRFTAHGAAEYAHRTGFGSVTGRVEANHQSSVYFDPTNSERFRGRARTLLNARLSARWTGWTAAVWVENLTDQSYETYRDDRTAMGVLRTTAYGPPRTYGVTVTRQF
ncbi:TonB-dependent receptor [Sphingobium sufflavum]|uniref:TonB-dependent receptor n=1 Tax=Sphingobium sufflavum TaxID=1129547 RepID=UPI001F2731C4|nr:TonB-dependent receptor [Sphingobium sufflavum]MCE7797105.1 TonB-dependent receptor [Sphingobium sufflavum]